MFFCGWADRHPLLVDARDEDHARAIATEVAGGESPTKVRKIPPGVAVIEVVTEEDEDGEECLTLDPLDHFAALLDRLDDEDDGLDHIMCMAEAEVDGGELVKCDRASHTDGNHSSVTSAGIIVTW